MPSILICPCDPEALSGGAQEQFGEDASGTLLLQFAAVCIAVVEVPLAVLVEAGQTIPLSQCLAPATAIKIRSARHRSFLPLRWTARGGRGGRSCQQRGPLGNPERAKRPRLVPAPNQCARAGPNAGSESCIHAVRALRPESADQANDCGIATLGVRPPRAGPCVTTPLCA